MVVGRGNNEDFELTGPYTNPRQESSTGSSAATLSSHEEDPQKATRARRKAGKVAILRHAQGHKEQAEICCSCNRYGKKNSSSQKRIKTSATDQELQLHYEGLLETQKKTNIFFLVAINRFFQVFVGKVTSSTNGKAGFH